MRYPSWRTAIGLGLSASLLVGVVPARAQQELPPVASIPRLGAGSVTALGRLSPKDGIVRVAGPSEPVVVISALLVRKGDLCIPLRNSEREVFAVAQLLNKLDGKDFDDADEVRFADFIADIGVILESWWQMRHGRAEETERADGRST